jgi:AmiR/NasT family two-component response regulator
MGTQGISARAAYQQLRSAARSQRRKLTEVCAEMIDKTAR